MHRVDSLSVVICTHNRAALLAETLQALGAARAPQDCRVDIVVVDNNSSDDTPAMVRNAAATSPFPIRYEHESRQGKSYALNRALEIAPGEVLALTDDDVLPGADWLLRIAQNFREHDVTFVFGKVLPRWETLPPPELLTVPARDIWGPLALIDYGDDVVRYGAASFGRQRLPIGANLAVLRSAVERVGGWRTDLGKVDNTLIAGEDHELCVRLYRAGLYSGIYDPTAVVRHYVPTSRMTRTYFRRWYFWHGRTMARMPGALYVDVDLTKVSHLAGVPRFVYRQFLEQAGRWLRHAGRSDGLAVLMEELKMLDYAGFFAEAWRLRWRHGGPMVAGASATPAVGVK